MTMRIGSRRIGPGHPTFVIAEMSANHGQDYDRAVAIVEAAKAAGADAIKLQTYTPDTITIDCDAPPFRIGKGSLWEGRRLYELYREACMPWEWQPRLKELAEKLGLCCFSTPFDATAVDFLERMDVPAHKIASFELVDTPLLQLVARTGKPIVMSTGMATLSEIDTAVRAIRAAGGRYLALLKCTSSYPALPAEMNLRTMANMAETFGVAVGLSDHTLGIAVPVAAVALGACIVEKHLTLSRAEPGPDQAFSLEPREFKDMVAAIRVAEAALGRVSYAAGEREAPGRRLRRSLFAVQDIKRGERFTAANVRSIRPGGGLPPAALPCVLGLCAGCDISRGTPLAWKHTRLVNQNHLDSGACPED